MYQPQTIRAYLLLPSVFVLSLAVATAYAQVAVEVRVAEVKAVEAKAAEAQAADVKGDDAKGDDAKLLVADVAVQAVQIVGEAVVEEGLEVAGEALQVFAAFEGDPQFSKLQSKVAVDNALVRRVCKLDADQLKQLNSMDAKWVKDKSVVAKQAGNFANGLLRVFVAPELAGAQQNNPAEAASRVTTAYKTKLKEILKPEQLEQYESLVKERDAFRRQANAECIVAVLEDRLTLNDVQRGEMVKALSEWSGIQKMQATFYFQNQAYIPNLPPSVLKALTPTQKKILDGMQKADFQFEMFNDGQEAIFIVE